MEIRNLQRAIRVNRRLVEKAAEAALEACGLTGRTVSVVLVNDRMMADLNLRFTGREGSTDVLAFPLWEGREDLGEVIVSAETCGRQAVEGKVPFDRELALLVVHGVLHLAGHDHARGGQAAGKMRRLERKIIGELGR